MIKRAPANRDTAIVERAEMYAARLYSSSLDEDEAAAMARWLSENEAHREQFEASLALLESVDALENDLDALLLCDAPARHRPLKAFFTAGAMLAMAACLCLGVLVASPFIRDYAHSQKDGVTLMQYSTAVGEQKSIRLADNSLIRLNTDSRLIVDFSGQERRTILARGEAFFDIARDEVRPFIVELGGRSITVLGTAFNVRKTDNGDTTIAVTKGVVAVHRTGESISQTTALINLKDEGGIKKSAEHERYRLERGAVMTLREKSFEVIAEPVSDIEKFESWRNGFTRFDAEPLINVVREINRYTDDVVIIDDPRAMTLKVNAVLQFDKIDSILDGLERTLPIRVTKRSRQTIITYEDNAD